MTESQPQPQPQFQIVREGFCFRALGPGYRSQLVTSASQAGLIIHRKAGAQAHRAAALDFINRTAREA